MIATYLLHFDSTTICPTWTALSPLSGPQNGPQRPIRGHGWQGVATLGLPSATLLGYDWCVAWLYNLLFYIDFSGHRV